MADALQSPNPHAEQSTSHRRVALLTGAAQPFTNPHRISNLPRPILSASKCFAHPWEFNQPGFSGVLKWKLCSGSKAPKFPSPAEAGRLLPSVASPSPLLRRFEMDELVDSDDGGRARVCPLETLTLTWAGHASFVLQCDGVTVLTDPVFSERCSAVQFAGPKRMVPPPLQVAALPRVHVVTITHNHYDHLDTATVKELVALHDPIFVVPLGMKSQWFDQCSFMTQQQRATRVVEVSWWEFVDISVTRTDGGAEERTLRVTGVPAQHWSMRTGPWDRNKQLWCGFVYEFLGAKGDGNEGGVGGTRLVGGRRCTRRAYHSGDTGYCDVFKTIGAAFGRHFDACMLPIGAYEPRWFMKNQHVDPREAVEMHSDLGSAFSVGMHWGTFILTDEPVDEPPKLLAQALSDKGIDKASFIALKHGETVVAPPSVKL